MDVLALADLIETDRAAAGKALDAALTAHHASGDARMMLRLHELAVRYWHGDPQQVAFHRTHAYVYALEAGDWDAVDRLHAELAAEGRV